ncbi:MAG: endonuclease/exonuclease/phosphatase family protein [Myxococcales bacterium]|nr:endonuclease/exonuclease/phosphatase family protein [Myxococcales bacterium]MCB9750981.1 endonuclease/exonuclease/phosphatase family protein [Myxococcales bacterium]
MTLRVATWNVWFGEWAEASRQAALWAELARLEPDVICLQEMTLPHFEGPGLRARRRRGDWISESPRSRYDVVTLARAPVRGSERVPLPSDMGRNLLITRLATSPPLTVATVHLESTAETTARRVQQLELITERLARERDVLLVGDMNFPDGERPEAAALAGWRDAWRELRPGDPGYTVDSETNQMRAWTNPRRKRARLDRALLRGDGWRFTAATRLGTRPLPEDPLTFISDHYGLLVELTPRER